MKVFQKIRSSPWIAHTLALLGGALFLLQAVIYAYIQTSFLDEGGYLYIGDLYMRGILKPFQDFAVPRWYAPLAFLIPGQIEKWFGASLLTDDQRLANSAALPPQLSILRPPFKAEKTAGSATPIRPRTATRPTDSAASASIVPGVSC